MKNQFEIFTTIYHHLLRPVSFFIFFNLILLPAYSQARKISKDQHKDINALIDKYTLSREKKDTVLLRSILTTDIDQLVSTGEWRDGIQIALNGMMASSSSNPGSRTITIDKIRLLNHETGIVDTRYEIKNTDGTARKMWSTFMVVKEDDGWKIAAIRNMLPSGQ